MSKPRITKSMQDAFKDGLTNPNAPLTPGEKTLLRHASGPRVVFIENEPEPNPGPVQIGELSHQPFQGDDDDIIDAEIVE